MYTRNNLTHATKCRRTFKIVHAQDYPTNDKRTSNMKKLNKLVHNSDKQ